MKNIQFNNLSFNFDQQPILKNITAKFTVGKIHLLTGVSGSGKSTILKLIAGLLPKYGGEIVAGAVFRAASEQGLSFRCVMLPLSEQSFFFDLPYLNTAFPVSANIDRQHKSEGNNLCSHNPDNLKFVCAR